MTKFLSLFSMLIATVGLLATGCSSDGGGAVATTFTVSGTLDPSAATNSLAHRPARQLPDLSNEEYMQLFNVRQFARTQCSDGQFYDVYCVSFDDNPRAASGDVDCAGSGAFSVAGMPLNTPIGCFVRRYADANPDTSGNTVGAIEIPAENLNGKSDSLVSNGDVALDINIGGDGSINATVVSGGDNLNNTSDSSNFTSALNGTYNLACTGNTGEFAILCKCFFDDTTYANQDACLADSASQITSSGGLQIEMLIHAATVGTGGLEVNNQTIAEGTEVKAFSIWASQNLVSSRGAGGDGVTDLGGKLNWTTTPVNPTTAIAWDSNVNATVKDGNNNDVTFTVPDLTAINGGAAFNDYTHAQWVTYAQAVAAAAGAAGFDCTWGPSNSDGFNGGTPNNGTTPGADIQNNVECVNQVMDALEESSEGGGGGNYPQVNLQPFCDNNGCHLSSDGDDSGNGAIYSATAFNRVRVNVDGIEMAYPNTADTNSTDHSAIAPNAASSIGASPQSRYVFEALIPYPNGAGFREKSEYTSHYNCINTTASGYQVQDTECNPANGYYELRCVVVDELSIKFIGSASPFQVVFDTVETVVAGQLLLHDGSTAGGTAVTPQDNTVLGLCNSKVNATSGIFTATATAAN